MTKSKITAEQVRQLGSLAKLSMTASEEERLRAELSSILEYFAIVDGVKDDVEIHHLTQSTDELRADDVAPSDPEGVFKGVPQKKGRLVKAPRVF